MRIEVSDEGGDFADAVLQSPDGKGYAPSKGSDGEVGSGFGLRILALYMDRLGGRLELCNLPAGGAAAVTLLREPAC